MKETTIAGKKVYIYDSHHEVLQAWSKYRGINVKTFDYHSDTMAPFYRKSHLYINSEFQNRNPYYCPSPESTKQYVEEQIKKSAQRGLEYALPRLANDEHIVYATSNNIINYCYVTCLTSNNTNRIFSINKFYWAKNIQEKSSEPNAPLWLRATHHTANIDMEYHGEKIIEYEIECAEYHPEKCHDDVCLVNIADSVLEEATLCRLENEFKKISPSFTDDYILDFDMDFFRTEKALHPQNASLFYSIIKHCTAITIATEEHCASELWLGERPIDCEANLRRFIEHIRKAVA